MGIVNSLLHSRKRFIDIGANIGFYSYFFSGKFENVDAFEPIFEVANYLYALTDSNIKLHNVSLSNEEAQLEFYIPIVNGRLEVPLGSLEKRAAPFEKRVVPVNTLDSYHYDDVDLIKIDVEGHELAVIEGAVGTISRCKPYLIIEIEQRHISKPIDDIFDFILQQGYDGFFLSNGSLKTLSKFSYSVNQEPFLDEVIQENYVNNFIFKPTNKRCNS